MTIPANPALMQSIADNISLTNRLAFESSEAQKRGDHAGLRRIKRDLDAGYADEVRLHADAASWFAKAILPMLTGHAGWRPGDGVCGWPYTDPERMLDHGMRCSASRIPVLVGMPYREAVRAKASLSLNGSPWEVLRLPDTWSWYYPGRSAILVAAAPGLLHLPPKIAEIVEREQEADLEARGEAA